MSQFKLKEKVRGEGTVRGGGGGGAGVAGARLNTMRR